MSKVDGETASGLRRSAPSSRIIDLGQSVADRQQMGMLLQVATEIGSGLELDAVLRRIVAAATSMTGARHGAIGVWASEGTLTSFVHSGMDLDAARPSGHLPEGIGVLGALRDRTEPLRLTGMTDDPDPVGVPGCHLPVRALLAMPVTIGGSVSGSLYVTDDRPGHSFGEADEVILRALASSASVAVENARLTERVHAAARWACASREINTSLLSEARPPLRPLQLIAERVAELTDAEQAIVLVPVDPDQPHDEVDRLVVSAAVGLHANQVVGQEISVADSTTGEVFRSGRPLITEKFRRPIPAFTDVGARPAIVMPLCSEQHAVGVIVVARNADAPPFDEGHLDLVRDFAGHAAVALTLATERRYERELTVLADRERIARDMHDQVISRVFAVGMELQGVVAHLRSPQLAARLTRSVDELQEVINDIRCSIFDLRQPTAGRRSFTQRVQDTVARLTEDHDEVTTLRLAGMMTAVSDDLAEHAEAVVGEALSYAVQHARATSIAVDISVTDELLVVVTDDGPGVPHDERRRDLADIDRRATNLGGHCTITTPSAGGTCVRWSAPLRGS